MVESDKKPKTSYGIGFLIAVGLTMVVLFAINGITVHLLLIPGYHYLPTWLQSGEPKMALQTILPVILMGIQYTIFDFFTVSTQPSHED